MQMMKQSKIKSIVYLIFGLVLFRWVFMFFFSLFFLLVKEDGGNGMFYGVAACNMYIDTSILARALVVNGGGGGGAREKPINPIKFPLPSFLLSSSHLILEEGGR